MTDWPAIAYQTAVGVGHPWPSMFVRQMEVESSWAEDVIYCQRLSPMGARGIAQFMPGTAAGLGIDPCEPYQALRAAAQLMKGYFEQYGAWDVALAAYNAGGGAVAQYGGVPPYPETQRYIQLILGGTSGYVPPPDNGGGYVPPSYTSDVNVPGLVLMGVLLWVLWG